MPFGFHWWDILIVVALGMVFFGPKRLPEMGSAIGKTIKEFQKSMHEVTAPKPDETAISAPATATSAPQLSSNAQPLPNAAPASSAPAAAVGGVSPASAEPAKE